MSVLNNGNKPDRADEAAGRPSSFGISSAVVTPKDVAPGDASAKDVVERNVRSDDMAEREEALLDDAIELSFPASDPIAVPSQASHGKALERPIGNKAGTRTKPAPKPHRAADRTRGG